MFKGLDVPWIGISGGRYICVNITRQARTRKCGRVDYAKNHHDVLKGSKQLVLSRLCRESQDSTQQYIHTVHARVRVEVLSEVYAGKCDYIPRIR